MNWLLNIFYKLTKSSQDQGKNSWQRISTSVQSLNLSAETKSSANTLDPYAEQLFHQKASMIEQSLLQARDQTKNINQVVKNTSKHPEQIELAIKEIIKSCESVSLSGIQILAGEAVYLKYQQQELVIQLPAYSKQILACSDQQKILPEMNQKIQELEKAISHSLDDLEKFLTQIETRQQNYLSAGIDLKLFHKQTDC